MCRKPRSVASGRIVRGLAAGLLAASALGVAPAAFAADPVAKTVPIVPATPLKAAPTVPTHKADAATRAAAERLDPLTRATFWAAEVQVDPTDAQAGTKLAASLRAIGRYEEASGAAGRVLIGHPDDVEALLEAGRADIAGGQAFYGIAPLEHAQAVAPGDWRIPALLGVAYSEVKRPADSEAAYGRALQLSPENPSVLSNKAMVLAARGDTPGAEVLLRRAAAQPTATIKERQNLALVLGYEGKLAEAEQLIRRDLPPEQADANLAYLKAVADAR